MVTSRRIPYSLLALALALPLAWPAPAGAADPGAEAARIDATSIEWSLGSAEKATLSVSQPGGKVWRHEFAAGQAPRFSIFDAKGAALPDGVYNFEIVGAGQPRVRGQAGPATEAGSGGYVRTGTFRIEAGAIVRSAPGAGRQDQVAATEDQVIPDDLIVQGSACVGFDCVNNESFGFDTIRLKENNLRIKFEDTSVGSFPTNDWQLTANDSASGGQSKFSIEDITGSRVPFTVTAGAATNSIFVDSTGRVGFRTSTPVLDLHINTSNTPALRMEQNNSGGFTAQTWDIGANEANFFVRDVTGGSRLSFRIRPGAPTSSIDISADGDVGIGTASPDEKLHVFENVNANTLLLTENPNAGDTALGGFRAKADVAFVNFQAHSSGRNIVRFGEDLGSWNEMLAVAGNGLILGTNTAVPLILGTNATSRMRIDGTTGAVTVSGNFTVTGVKNFATVDPGDSSRAIYYAALEGPEAGTYQRGSARTTNGEAVIELPGHFSRVTEKDQMTVQLTPLGSWGQLYVVEKTPERIVVRVAPGTEDLEFDYFVQGVRKGYLDYQVERANDLPQ